MAETDGHELVEALAESLGMMDGAVIGVLESLGDAEEGHDYQKQQRRHREGHGLRQPEDHRRHHDREAGLARAREPDQFAARPERLRLGQEVDHSEKGRGGRPTMASLPAVLFRLIVDFPGASDICLLRLVRTA